MLICALRTVSEQDVSHALANPSIDLSSPSEQSYGLCPRKNHDRGFEGHAAYYT